MCTGQSKGHRQITRMGGGKDGPFTPIVVLVRNQVGTKQFNQLRGKAISLHSQGDFLSRYLDLEQLTRFVSKNATSET